MKKLLNKWYFGLIIIPILINYLTDAIGLPQLFKNWLYTTIGIQAAFIVIIVAELLQLNNKIKEINSRPKQSDKKIVNELLNTLDINSFQEDIKEKNSWYGYKKSAISRTFDFSKKADLVSYKTTDIKLNELIMELKEAIDDFNDYCSSQLFPYGDYYAPAKDKEFNFKKAEKTSPVMNHKAERAFVKLVNLIDYVKEKNYLEN